MKPTPRVFSGAQPTNGLHLGNYLGALKNWANLQQQGGYEFIFCVVDLHAITVPRDPAQLVGNVREVVASYIASGIDPANCIIYPQSAVAAHCELSWILGTITPLGWLNRMTQFKEKAGKHKEEAGLGLYSYPVLMAADILLYHTTHVPVGEDQKQHLELARDIAGAFNRRFGETFVLPEPLIMGEGARIMSLRDGHKKMSKSDESDMSRINLSDDADTIAQKFRKAKTDMFPLPESVEDLENRPEAKNLVSIYAALANQTKADVLKEHGGEQFSTFKKALTDLAVEKLSPITGRMNELMKDPAQLDAILKTGAEKANTLAATTMHEIKAKVGLADL